MKLYKFRSLNPPDFTLDILLKERLYCARHQDLNDPFEGLFSTIEYRGGGLARPLARPLASSLTSSLTGDKPTVVVKSLNELPSLRNVRVCSLSSEMADIRMWSHYAASHTGCAIEIDIVESPILHPVEYASGVRKLADGLDDDSPASDVLAFKTDHWAHEKEHRFITTEEYVSITGQVTAVMLGLRVSKPHREQILKIAENRFSVFSTKLNHDKVEIDKDRQLSTNPS